MKEKWLIVRMFGMFDWRKGARCLMSVAVALCAFTGRAADADLPFGLGLMIFSIGVLEAPSVIPGETESRTNRYTGPKKPVRQH